MSPTGFYHMAADGLLIIHAGFILFVVVGFAAILLGLALRWRWVRHLWFRLLHLCAIGVVMLQAWLGWPCPLTVWESALRQRAGDLPDQGAFVQYWLHRLIFFQAEAWVFTTAYTGFAIAVLLVWIFAPPRIKSSQ